MTTIDLRGACTFPSNSCEKLMLSEVTALDTPQFRKGAAVVSIPDFSEWVASRKSMRSRANRADRRGYTTTIFEPREYHDDMIDINRSKEIRQGRPMADHYWNRVKGGLIGPSPCFWHHRLEYGIMSLDGRLRGYAGMIRCGELLHVSMFLGHADFLDDGIMYKLIRDVVAAETLAGGVHLFYHRYDGGQAGLRFFKDRIGMAPTEVTWKT